MKLDNAIATAYSYTVQSPTVRHHMADQKHRSS